MPGEPQPRLVPPTNSEPSLAEAHRHDARAEARAEREAGALVAAVDLLQGDAHDRAVRLVADEELLLERAELAAGQVASMPLADWPILP